MNPLPRISPKTWSRAHAAHLLQRAGFGAAPGLLDRFAALTPEEAVESLLKSEAPQTREESPAFFHAPEADNRLPGNLEPAALRALPEETRRELRQQSNRMNREHLGTATAWWMDRMIQSPNPFEEKLALFWHGHFATSSQKVRAAYPMLAQNLLFRDKGLGDWPALIEAVAKDPAMLVYLDNARSTRRSPNENFARELLELFTLGEGHYTEEDIRSAARAFTGWSLHLRYWRFQFKPAQADTLPKTFLDQTGSFDGQEIIGLITRSPRASLFLTEKIWRFFASDTPDPENIRTLAEHFRQEAYSLRALFHALFLHPAFYAPGVRRNQIKGPVQLLAQLGRSLEIPAPAPPVWINGTRQLGQTLFAPPSVKGWDGGSAWITASTLARRYSLTEQILRSRNLVDINRILPDRTLSRREVRESLFDRFYLDPLRPEDRARIDHHLASAPPPADWTPRDLIHALLPILQSPQYQLC